MEEIIQSIELLKIEVAKIKQDNDPDPILINALLWDIYSVEKKMENYKRDFGLF